MKRAFFILAVSVTAIPALGQCQCAFTTPTTKSRHDQYSRSSKTDADKSKKDMDAQMAEFDKKKYQSTVKNSKATAYQKRKTTAQRFD
jgi:hypothetical protein